jgi:hypothetical protein
MVKPARQESIYPQTAFSLSTGMAMADDNWLRSGDPDENSVVFCVVWISAFCLGPHIIYCVHQNREATFNLRIYFTKHYSLLSMLSGAYNAWLLTPRREKGSSQV